MNLGMRFRKPKAGRPAFTYRILYMRYDEGLNSRCKTAGMSAENHQTP